MIGLVRHSISEADDDSKASSIDPPYLRVALS